MLKAIIKSNKSKSKTTKITEGYGPSPSKSL